MADLTALGTSAPGSPAPGAAAWGTPAAVAAMLEARGVALVGASQRPGTLGERMVAEMSASPSRPRLYLVNPRYTEIGGLRCHPSLGDVPEPVDLVLLGVPDAALEQQLSMPAGATPRRSSSAAPMTCRASRQACAGGWLPSPRRPGWHCAARAAWAS
jgi:hypothetical protein